MGDVKQFVSEKDRGLGVKFERIRRITGYLTGTVDSWGTAKQHEGQDRVKHTSSVAAA